MVDVNMLRQLNERIKAAKTEVELNMALAALVSELKIANAKLIGFSIGLRARING